MAYRKLSRKRTPQEILEVKRAWYYRTYQPKSTEPPVKAGDRYGRLTIQEVYREANNKYAIVCACDCGATVHPRLSYVLKGRVKSCGCGRRAFLRNTGNIRFGGLLP